MVSLSLEYASDVEGGAPVRVQYAISGRLDASTYLKFVEERANWLGLHGWAAADGPCAITLVAAGAGALVGALEMACTLGPLDAFVDAIVTTEAPDAVPEGFRLRT